MSKLKSHFFTFLPTIYFWLSSMLGNVFSWALIILLGRGLSLSEFAVLSLYASMQNFLSILSGPMSMTAIKFTGEQLAKKETNRDFQQVRLLGGNGFILATIITLLYILLSPLWTKFLHFPNSILLITISVLIINAQFMHSWLLGIIQAMQRFYLSGSLNLIFGISKLLIVSLIFILPFKLELAVGSYPISTILIVLISIFYLHKNIKLWHKKMFDFKQLNIRIKHFYMQNVLLRIGTILLLNTDVLLVNHFFDKQTAGIYGLLSMLGKMLFFVNSSFTAILIPLIASKLQHRQHTRKILLIVLGAILLASFGFVVVFVFFGKFSLTLMFGDKGLLVLPYLFKYSLNMMFLSIIFTISSYQLIKSRFYLNKLLIIGGIVEILLIYWQHQHIQNIIDILLVIDITLFLLIIFSFRRLFGNFIKKTYV